MALVRLRYMLGKLSFVLSIISLVLGIVVLGSSLYSLYSLKRQGKTQPKKESRFWLLVSLAYFISIVSELLRGETFSNILPNVVFALCLWSFYFIYERE